jgi:ADP-ribose pyrophosphatase
MVSVLKRTGLPRVISRQRKSLSKWVALETISVARPGSKTEIDVYHAFNQSDYVVVLPMTRNGQFLLVKQYRPVLGRRTLELPGGLRASREEPKAAAARELCEETGFAALDITPLVACNADVGRLSNKFFGFFAMVDRCTEPEPGIKVVLLSGRELRTTATRSQLAPASHVALLYLAAINPHVQKLCRQAGYVTPPWI